MQVSPSLHDGPGPPVPPARDLSECSQPSTSARIAQALRGPVNPQSAARYTRWHGKLASGPQPLVSPFPVKLLFLTPRVPYPLDTGTSLRNFRLLQSAAREHEVHLFSFQDRALRPDHLEALQAVCHRVELRPAPPHPAYRRLARMLGSPLPDMAYRRWSPGFAAVLKNLLEAER